jgi:hypothetical protein
MVFQGIEQFVSIADYVINEYKRKPRSVTLKKFHVMLQRYHEEFPEDCFTLMREAGEPQPQTPAGRKAVVELEQALIERLKEIIFQFYQEEIQMLSVRGFNHLDAAIRSYSGLIAVSVHLALYWESGVLN